MILATRESAAAWELRTAWALRRAVVLSLDVVDLPRVAGWVETVAATDAFADVETPSGEVVRVQCGVVLSVRSPHFHEPADGEIRLAGSRERRRTVVDDFPGQLDLFSDPDGQLRIEA